MGWAGRGYWHLTAQVQSRFYPKVMTIKLGLSFFTEMIEKH